MDTASQSILVIHQPSRERSLLQRLRGFRGHTTKAPSRKLGHARGQTLYRARDRDLILSIDVTTTLLGPWRLWRQTRFLPG
jgi:hypothetical protein